jgi:hypothetical protein
VYHGAGRTPLAGAEGAADVHTNAHANTCHVRRKRRTLWKVRLLLERSMILPRYSMVQQRSKSPALRSMEICNPSGQTEIHSDEIPLLM